MGELALLLMTPSPDRRRRLHLNVNALNAGVFGGSWRHPDHDATSSYSLEHYLRIARKAEEAKFDGVFLADGPVIAEDLRYRSANSLEPSTVLTAIATRTERLGLIGTFSSTYNDPAEIARRVLSLDLLSGGRVGWNVVTTAGSGAARNFGFEGEPDHAGRYDRAALVVDIAQRLWDGDDVDGRSLGLPRSPQGRPVIVQAGGSADGVRLAARVAEVVFSAAQTLDDALAFAGRVRDGGVGFGRNRSDVTILPGLSTVIGSTEREAAERRELLSELVPEPYALARLSGQLGFPLEDLDLDAPVPTDRLVAPEQAGGSQTFYAAVLGLIEREKPTLRQLLRHLGGGAGHRIVVGTPERVADDIEHWFRSGAADGFNLMPDVLPSGLDDFADHVVPILQDRGLFRREYEGETLRSHLGETVDETVGETALAVNR
ncbi:MAG: Nitrilotriacetate monooxygenase [Frondihabitans sp.]|nr:Nitrilotriacetate monooxygenase [Frondihabitans sp.]